MRRLSWNPGKLFGCGWTDGPVAGWNVGQWWPGWVGCGGIHTYLCQCVCVCFFGCGLLAIFFKTCVCVCVCLRHSRDVYTFQKPIHVLTILARADALCFPSQSHMSRQHWDVIRRQVSQLQTPHVLWRLRIPDRVSSLEFFQQACPTLDPIQYWCLRIRVDLIMYIWLL